MRRSMLALATFTMLVVPGIAFAESHLPPEGGCTEEFGCNLGQNEEGTCDFGGGKPVSKTLESMPWIADPYAARTYAAKSTIAKMERIINEVQVTMLARILAGGAPGGRLVMNSMDGIMVSAGAKEGVTLIRVWTNRDLSVNSHDWMESHPIPAETLTITKTTWKLEGDVSDSGTVPPLQALAGCKPSAKAEPTRFKTKNVELRRNAA